MFFYKVIPQGSKLGPPNHSNLPMATLIFNNSTTGNITPSVIAGSSPPTKNGFTIAIVVIQIIVIIVALIGNILVCCAILVYERLRSTLTNFFIFSLAISDIITASIAMPFDVDVILNNHLWRHGEVMCNIFVTAYLVAAPLSMLNLLAVSVDRYCAITNPLHYNTLMTRKVVIITIISLWTYAILFTVIAMLGWPFYPTSVHQGVCTFNVQPAYSVVSSAVNFVSPTIIMCVLYYRIYKVAHAHVRKINRRENVSHALVENTNLNINSYSKTQTERKSLKSLTKNIKAAKTIALLVSGFLFCWMPYTLTSSISIFCGQSCYENISADVFTVTLLIAYTNSALNPFLYALHNRDFRESFRRFTKLKFHYV